MALHFDILQKASGGETASIAKPRLLLRLGLLIVSLVLIPPALRAQLLIREVVSREMSVHVGGVQTPDTKEVVSREVSLHVENGSENRTLTSRQVSLAMGSAAVPPAITTTELLVQASPTGDSVTLDWSSYNQWAVGDISHFVIYFTDDGAFTDVSGMTPHLVVPGESSSVMLTGLEPWRDHYFAVVAVDVLGNFIPNAVSSAAYVLMPQVISREVSLFIGGEPESPGKQVISREISLAMASPEPPPPVTGVTVILSPAGDSARLDWDSYNLWAVGDVARFDIYYSPDGPISNVTALTPLLSVGGEQTFASVANLEPWRDHYFAVVAVDASGNSLPGVHYAAGYMLMPQVISREVALFMGSEGASPYKEVVSREISLVMGDASVPDPVTGPGSGFFAETSNTRFGAVALDWSSYNEWAQADVVRYRVYVAGDFFEDVSGMTPFAYLPAGSLRQTLGGLTGLGIYHFAVVAEDSVGNFNPSVRSASAQASVPGLGEVRGLAVTASGPDSLTVSWQPPQGTENFLAGYRVHFGGGQLTVDLPLSVTEWTATHLERGHGYPIRVTTLNAFGGESSGSSVVGTSWLYNPANTVLTTAGDEVVLAWEPGQPSALVQYYAIYRSDGPFSNVTGMTPVTTRTGTSAVLGGFAEVADRYFAVQVVNVSNGSDPHVVSVRATKQLQTLSFPPLAAGPLQIPLTAVASSGLPVSFSSSSNAIAQVSGPVLQVKQGGPITVTARQAGDANFWPISVSQTLRLPPAITSFTANNNELTPTSVLRQMATTLRVEAKDVNGIAEASFLGRVPGLAEWVPLGTDNVPNNGFTAILPLEALPYGPYELKAVVTAREGYTAETTRTVLLDLQPVLTLNLGGEVQEGGSLTGTVSIQTARPTDLVVSLTSSQPTQLDTGPPVTIPAGQTSATVAVHGRQDHVVEAPQSIRVTASTPGASSVERTVTLLDDDWPLLTLKLDRAIVSESDGPTAIRARVERDVVTPLPLTVWLTNTNPGVVNAPSLVVIPGGGQAVEFAIGVVDNDVSDGTKTASLRAEVRLSGLGAISQTSAVDLTIGDDEGPALELVFDDSYLTEGQSGLVRMRRLRGPTAAALSVTLATTPSGELQTPSSVIIPAGAAETVFSITAVQDGAPDGNKTVRVTATANGHSPAQIQFVVTDAVRPDLAVIHLSAPVSVRTEESFSLSYQVANRGTAAAAQSFVQRVFLSRDPILGDDILLAQNTFSGGLAADSSFQRSESLRAPREAGTYWLIAVTDAGGLIEEIIESNNFTIATEPLIVGAAYAATVQTEATFVPANTPITFTGSAIDSNGTKVPNALVNIYIRLGETQRTIAAITNATGDYSTRWQPLPGEGGDYEVAATHPGTPTGPTQDTFSILTLKTEFSKNTITLDEASSASLMGVLSNPTTHIASGVSVQAIGLPPGLSVAASLPRTQLAPGESMQAGVTLTSNAGFSGAHTVTLRVTTAQGVSLDVPLSLFIRPLLPKLVISPNPLKQSALRGSQKVVNVTLENQGGADSGPVNVLLPDVPWMEMASAVPLPSIPPGGSSSFSILLKPAAVDALTLYNGNLIVAPASGPSLNLPFAIRIVSDQRGDLEIEVVDEAYYHSEGSPKVAGATVTVRDAVSAEKVASQTTPASGRARFADLQEGWYSVEVESPDHARWKGNLQVNAAEPNFRQVFISMETVKYTWTVEKIEIDDRYRISVESTFETNVPAPVVTVTPAVLDVEDLTVLGQTKVINFVIDNHGWIAANNSRFSFDQHPFYEVTPLIEDIGTIPAKSSVVIPVMVRRIQGLTEEGSVRTIQILGNAMETARATPMNNGAACGFAGRVNWSFPCGPVEVSKSTGIPASGVAGDCGGGWWPVGSGGGGGGMVTSSASAFGTNEASCLDLCLYKAGVDCFAGFVPVVGCTWAISNCLVFMDTWNCGTVLICPLGPVGNGILCVANFIKCFEDNPNKDNGMLKSELDFKTSVKISVDQQYHIGDPWLDLMDGPSRNFDPKMTAAVQKIETLLDFSAVLLGNRERVIRQIDANVAKWYEDLKTAMEQSSESGSSISIKEQNILALSAVSNGLDYTEFLPIIERFNRTFDYARRGILAEAHVPAGESLDFIPWNKAQEAAIAVMVAYEQSRIEGFADPGTELLTRYNAVQSKLLDGQGGVCAQVKIRIDQEAVMTRSAFRANLELANNRPNSDLTQVGFDLRIQDAEGNNADDRFNIQVSKLTGLSAVDGTGEVPSLSSGAAQWTLIPRDTAAPIADTVYTIGGTISYSQSGTLFTVPVAPVRITVRPDAALHLKYFHQRDVFGDDPHTDVIEPSIPYHLAVMVENRGAGAARNLTITSAQPEIIENEKGLLIDFSIIGTQVAGQASSPSLMADFGSVQPDERKVATWDITSSLQGLFIDYKATFQHLDGFGDERISLIKGVDIHEMIQMFEAQGALDDGLPDFLVNDVPDIDDRPDTVHLSDGSTAPVTVVETGTLSSPVSSMNLVATLTTTQGAGWSYLRIPDPSNGSLRLVKVARSDGSILPTGKNAWITGRTFVGLGKRPVYENILHLVDFNSTGQYTLTYEEIGPDVVPPSSTVEPLAAQSPQIVPVRWSGQDDRGVAYFDIYVSVDGEPFELWLGRTTRISSLYLGEMGRTYGFYSRATDTSGNVEAAPLAAQTVTVTGLQNHPPELESAGPFVVQEGDTLHHFFHATDPDGDTSLLRFSITADSNAVTIHPETGQLTWATQETDGGRTLQATVTVTDSGWPTLTASSQITINVQEVNQPPHITPVPSQVVIVGGTMQTTVSARDDDLPLQTLTFARGTPFPSGMSIDPTTGTLRWTPGDGEVPRLLAVDVLVTDNGEPPQSVSVQVPVHLISVEDSAEQVASVTTQDAGNVGTRSFLAGGMVTDAGGGVVSERGIVYSTMPNPTTLSANRISAGSGTGSFSVSVTVLETDTEYHVRAYAINSAGTAYGNPVVVRTLPDDGHSRRLLYLKSGDPNQWAAPGASGSQSGEIEAWKAAGFKVTTADAAVTMLADIELSEYHVIRLFTDLEDGDYPDTSGAALERWVRNGGVAIVEAAHARSLNAVKRFGVTQIDGAGGGGTGAEWKHYGTPLMFGPVAAPLGPVQQMACEKMDRPVLQTKGNLKVAAKIKADPAIVHGVFGSGKVVIHFMAPWSQDASLPFHSSLDSAGNRAYLERLIEYAGRPGRWVAKLPESIMVAQEIHIPLSGDWTVLSVSGLPPGVRYDSTSQTIIGRPSKSGSYTVGVKIKTTLGTVISSSFVLDVRPLPPQALGSFVADLERNQTIGAGLGGTVNLKVTATGSASGQIVLAGKRHAFKGVVTTVSSSEVFLETSVSRGSKSPALSLRLNLGMDDLLTGEVKDGAEPASVKGWRIVWHRQSKTMPGLEVSLARRGPVNLAMDLPGVPWRTASSVPQGVGYATMTVTNLGAVRLTGRHMDGTVVTLSSHLGPDGDLSLWAPLYKNTGSVILNANLDAAGSLTGTGDTVRLPQGPKEKLYRDGFGHASVEGLPVGPVPLVLAGGKWNAPKNAPVMELPYDPINPLPNAWLHLADAGIKTDTDTETPVLPLVITDKNKALVQAANPAEIKVSIASKTGLVSGSFKLQEKAPKLVRSIKFQALCVPGLEGTTFGGGSFALPQRQAIPAVILSGRVLLFNMAPNVD